jgi:hypothetical protein
MAGAAEGVRLDARSIHPFTTNRTITLPRFRRCFLARLEIDDIQNVIAKSGREQALAFEINARVIDSPLDRGERDGAHGTSIPAAWRAAEPFGPSPSWSRRVAEMGLRMRELYSANSRGPSTAANLFRRLRIRLCLRKFGWTILQNCFSLASRALLLVEQSLNTLRNHRMPKIQLQKTNSQLLVN